MKAILIACLVFVSVSTAGTITISDPNTNLSAQQKESISAWFNILVTIYDNDVSLIPDDPNEILALETSENPRDLIAWQIFKMLRYALDPNSAPPDETVPVISNEPNTTPQSVVSTTETTVNVVETESLQEMPASDNVLLFGEIELPPLQEPNEPTAVFMQSPASSSGPQRGELDNFAEWSRRIAILSEDDSEPNVIEINSDITTNQVWDANNVYYITDVNGIDVQALLVIEPGTTVIFGYQCGLFVNNGGTLVAKGTPNEPIICTPDYMYFSYPDYIGYYWQALASYGPYYYCPIYIQDTASPATTVRYCMIEGAVGGIVTSNIRLANPIENNYLFGNIYGIFEFGPKLTDIRNNLCFYNDEAGIEAYLAPDPNDVPDTDYPFTIEQNTCDSYQYCGITVHGVAEPNKVPTVHLLNNIVSSSYWYGLNLVDGYMQMLVVNTGYYDNGQNKNWEFDEYNPVIAQSNPYYPYIGEKPYWHHHLAEGSGFIDAGSQYIEQTELIGTTTNFDGLPDKDIVDLGFHRMDWDYTGGEGIAGTDIDDLITLSNYWLTYTPYDPNSPGYIDPNLYIYDPNHPENWIDPNFVSFGGDWNDDGFVDLADFSILAANWLDNGDMPPISLTFDQEPNNISGDLTVTSDATDPAMYRTCLWMDGQMISDITSNDGEPGQTIIRTNDCRNGRHEFKLVSLYNNQIIISPTVEGVFNNGISSVTQPKGFEPGKDYYLYAICDPNDVTYSIELYDDVNEITTFSTECSNGLAVCIPYTAFPEEYGIYDLNITRQEEGEMMLLSVDDQVNYVITHKFDLADSRNPYFRMVISIGSKDLQTSKEKCWKAAVKAAVTKSIYPVVLKYEDCTWDNLKFCLQLNNVKMWYHLAHGNHDLIGQPPRQCIKTASGLVFSYLKKDYGPNIPPDYEELWWFYENNHSIAELGFQGGSKMTWVQFNACYSARTLEFPYMLGILPIKDPGAIGKQVFVGWKNSALVYDIIGRYNQFEEDYWGQLTLGHSLKTAVEDSLPPGGGTNILENFMYYGVIDWQYAHFRYPNIN